MGETSNEKKINQTNKQNYDVVNESAALALLVESDIHRTTGHFDAVEFRDGRSGFLCRGHDDNAHAARFPTATTDDLRTLNVADLLECLTKGTCGAVEWQVGYKQLAVGLLLASGLRYAKVVVFNVLACVLNDGCGRGSTTTLLLLLLWGLLNRALGLLLWLTVAASSVRGHVLALDELRTWPIIKQPNNQATTFKLRFVEEGDGTSCFTGGLHRHQS
mmetsp:Transcript_60966/g.70817  ORF Transcript_60966/g.70817 Transcript_60966/m.70817 type:complete len:218 (-) Transcript_60966:281-934(-)